MRRRAFLRAVATVAFAAAVGFPDLMRPRTALDPRIRISEGGLCASRVENAGFRLSKAMLAIAHAARDGVAPTKAIFEKVGAGAEFELLKEVEEIHRPADVGRRHR